jgi:3-oxoacyl-[acyl-carrier-protein] synthase II
MTSMQAAVYLTGLGSISALGHTPETVAESYRAGRTRIRLREVMGKPTPVAPLPDPAEQALARLLESNARYRELDRSVHLALYAARQAARQAGWLTADGSFGVILGSSRGATGLLERFHREFLDGGSLRTASQTSPTTTLGNIASWVAQDVQTRGPATEISSTCSTSIYAVGSALAWLRAGFNSRFLAGGSEAPLTDFTIAQMKALRVYSRDVDGEYPCRACAADQGKRNSMVLGEGACVVAMEQLTPGELVARAQPPLARIDGAGFFVEPITTATSLSLEGAALARSMLAALENTPPQAVDLVVTHTPGTALGDQSELSALRRVFGKTLPILTSNKWMLGHTVGAAGIFNVEYALHALRTQHYAPYPYPVPFRNEPRPIRRVLVNSVGFGGNAGSLLLAALEG